MKLKEYMSLKDPGDEVTCWDTVIDSEFYFYNKEVGEKSLYGADFPNVEKCDELLRELLDVVKLHDRGIEVNLYELLENPKVVEFAKKHMFEEHQYKDDDDVVMMLFDDNVKNLSYGFEGFSGLMVQCLNYAYGFERNNVKAMFLTDFSDDAEKMRDFFELTKEEFLASYSYLTDEEYEATKAAVSEKKSLSDLIDKTKDISGEPEPLNDKAQETSREDR